MVATPAHLTRRNARCRPSGQSSERSAGAGLQGHHSRGSGHPAGPPTDGLGRARHRLLRGRDGARVPLISECAQARESATVDGVTLMNVRVDFARTGRIGPPHCGLRRLLPARLGSPGPAPRSAPPRRDAQAGRLIRHAANPPWARTPARHGGGYVESSVVELEAGSLRAGNDVADCLGTCDESLHGGFELCEVA